MAGFVTRFAPSPTGPLHLGHAFSALLAHDMAVSAGGRFVLRIEDIDRMRCRPEWEARIYDDLAWLGLRWEQPVMRQSERGAAYESALDALWHARSLYACACTRRDIEHALTAPQEGTELPVGPDGRIYPGTCRPPSGPPCAIRPRPKATTLRLNLGRAEFPSPPRYRFRETGQGVTGASGTVSFSIRDLTETIGDFVVARRDLGTSYHLAVVLDDAAQGISHVVRGADLYEATKIHVMLQNMLDLPQPVYHHHRLIRDDQGKRLAKRDDARALATYRSEGATPADIRRMVGL